MENKELKLTTAGLPNTCAGCGGDPGPEWYAVNDEQAVAGQGFCERCAFAETSDSDVEPTWVKALEEAGFNTLEAVRAASDQELEAIPGIGKATVRSIREWLED